ncbi:hypothetical protein SAMN05216345_1288 [Cupriavidus sp. YR651]|nr:hypothetical protein SAMN05216345_1288 [Cupriavidus sp. YR651]
MPAYPRSALCEVPSVSVNGYRAWKRGGTAERQRPTDTQLLTLASATSDTVGVMVTGSTLITLSKHLRRRGGKYSTHDIYALTQAIGRLNDDVQDCWAPESGFPTRQKLGVSNA